MNKLANLYKYLKVEGFSQEASLLFLLYKTAANYVIKPGDTAYKLSGGDPAYQKSIEDANPNLDWTKLQIGQVINLPKKPILLNQNIKYSEECKNLIKKFEEFRPIAYDDDGWWAVGYGHRYGRVGQAPRKRVTLVQAEQLLKNDMDLALGYIKRNIKVRLNQHQVDALVSIVYNTGPTTFHKSDLKKIIDSGNLLLAGKMMPTAFISSPGHKDRRYAESIMFKGGT